ncbi:hypothetical protein HJC23_004527 [Cyclotella cryptica]|uniref:Type III pantothenate kinase n=1 Tax=Cyclotella cryptica TaxID=29204 RepID=A0ABD3P323_9STRA|eukprot:CCRYP_018060-RA/>CCRYP_018060-RA protein AED:0.08 eAED:0.08 QI:392/1/1/1/0.5/0.33/3/185/580
MSTEQNPPLSSSPLVPPLDQEEYILTISSGNTHLHWATHHGVMDDFNPKIFWRTPHIHEDDITGENLVAVLSRLIPDDTHDYIFGKDEEASVEAALRQSKMRAVPTLSVYVVSTNRTQAYRLEKLLETIPSRFHVMQGDEFFSKKEGRYADMGTDRLATLAGAAHMHGHPALVFDGGTATTYSATDCAGNILGGGIGPGLHSKLESMAQTADALPNISRKEVEDRVRAACAEGGKPLPTFATSTEEAMLGDVFQELALKGRNVIGHWLQKAYNSSRPHKAGCKLNTEKKVLCTGGDGEILQLLLQPHSGGLIEAVAEEDLEYEVEVSKHLIHYGIAAVLCKQAKLQQKKDEFVKKGHEEHLGKRVAKVFDVETDEGDNIYRGTVVEVFEVDGKKEYRIKYDDGDVEDVYVETLFDMYELYAAHGDKRAKNGKTKEPGKRGRPSKADLDNIPAKKSNAPKKSEKKEKKTKKEKPSKSTKEKKVSNNDEGAAPAVKKAKTIDPITAMINSSEPKSFVRLRVAKDFDGVTYFGTVMEYDDSEEPAFWHIQYDDGDEEDYSKKDLIQALKLYKAVGKDDPCAKS